MRELVALTSAKSNSRGHCVTIGLVAFSNGYTASICSGTKDCQHRVKCQFAAIGIGKDVKPKAGAM